MIFRNKSGQQLFSYSSLVDKMIVGEMSVDEMAFCPLKVESSMKAAVLNSTNG
jgi:hypothetical protein